MKGEFCGCFRISAKTGLNINESIEFLIRNIIKRIEDMNQKGNEPIHEANIKCDSNKKLNPKTHNSKAQESKGGCC